MTSEQRLIFDLEEIKSVRFQCKHCGFVMGFEPGKWKDVPRECHSCGRQWFKPDSYEIEAVLKLSQALRDFLHPDVTGLERKLGCSFCFEIATTPGEKDKSRTT